MKITKKTIFASLFIFFLLVGSCFADINEEMDSMFNSMINITEPSSYIGQRRGAFDAGSMVVKNRIVNADFINFNPPRLDAGCGGIDFFGGSFSFINADQFIALARGIASNAAGYAFNLAMSSMCPSCAAEISKLQRAIQQMNEMAGNSCKIAQLGVNTLFNVDPAKKSLDTEDSVFGPAAKWVGGKADDFSAFLDRVGQDSPSSTMTSEQFYDTKSSGNITYRVLMEGASPMSSWFAHGDKELTEIIMSLVGTMIVSKPEDDKKPVSVTTKPPIIKLNDIMGDAGLSVTLNVYDCNDANCLDMDEEDRDIEPMIGRVNRLLFGDGALIGIVDKYINNAGGEMTLAQKQLLDVLPEHGKRIRDLAIMNPGGARTYTRLAAKNMALEMVTRLVQEVITGLKIASNAGEFQMMADLKAQIADLEKSLYEERLIMSQGMINESGMANHYESLRNTGRNISIFSPEREQ